uniref:Uncharacterized protein n=1 Tax=Oryza nivara TaxID=4536 RepID=A0A0E0IH98_ORYNI
METDATILSHVLHLRRRPPPAQPPSAPSSPATAAESQPKTTSIPPDSFSTQWMPLLIFAVVRDREELRSSEMTKGNLVVAVGLGNDFWSGSGDAGGGLAGVLGMLGLETTPPAPQRSRGRASAAQENGAAGGSDREGWRRRLRRVWVAATEITGSRGMPLATQQCWGRAPTAQEGGLAGVLGVSPGDWRGGRRFRPGSAGVEQARRAAACARAHLGDAGAEVGEEAARRGGTSEARSRPSAILGDLHRGKNVGSLGKIVNSDIT